MRSRSIIIACLLTITVPLVHAQVDCNAIGDQGCCYSSGTAYCCDGSLLGDQSSDDSLAGIICCQNDGRAGNIVVGFGSSTCKAGTSTPLTALPTAPASVIAAISSISVSRSLSRQSLFASASASRASAASASQSGSSVTMTSSRMQQTTSGSSASAAAPLTSATMTSTSGSASSSSTSSNGPALSTTAMVTSSRVSTAGAPMATDNQWGGAVLIGGLALAAAAF